VSTPALHVEDLTKRYGSTAVVDSLDLVVDSDEVFGFLGPNGAGKSTTIGMLLDFVRPTSGVVRVLGRDPQRDVVDVHERIGVLPDRYSLYPDLTAQEHLKFVIETKRANDDPDELLARVGLSDARDDPTATFSQGMEQRLALAMALVGTPDLLVLDEPFSGLDPHGVRTVREIVHEENKRGAAVLFSSHVLGQVELVCDRVGIIHRGSLIASGTLEELLSQADVEQHASMESVFVSLTDDTAPIETETGGAEQ
jgi:ABC-2 type transport system ATP-binding protein